MKNYKEFSENEALGDIAPELRVFTRQLEMEHPNRYWEKLCPPRKAMLVVDALAGETSIYNLDHGSFVTQIASLLSYPGPDLNGVDAPLDGRKFIDTLRNGNDWDSDPRRRDIW